MALLLAAWLTGCGGRTIVLRPDRLRVGDAAAYLTTRPLDPGGAQVEISAYDLPAPELLRGHCYVVWAGPLRVGALTLRAAGGGPRVHGVLKARLAAEPRTLSITVEPAEEVTHPSGLSPGPLFFY